MTAMPPEPLPETPDGLPAGDAAQAAPFIKWVGGKRAVLSEITRRLPGVIPNYFEPFIGGGAVFYAISPRIVGRATLLDHNAELVNAYLAVRDTPETLLGLLREHELAHDKEHYYAVRAQQLSDPIERAARLIYLNKTGFNGLYRVNSKGGYNVPMGSYKNPVVADAARIANAAAALSRATIRNADFATIEADAQAGDFVYFDPPYAPLDASSFTKYTSADFGQADQERLLELVLRLTARGALVMLSNSKTPYTEALYDRPGLRTETVLVPRYVNRDAAGRGAITEVLVTNYEPGANAPGLDG